MKRVIVLAGTLLFLIGCGRLVKYNPAEWVTYAEQTDFQKTPRYEQTVDYCRRLADASTMVTYTSFGTSPQGRELPLLIVDRDGLDTPDKIRQKGRVVMFVEACIHSGEPDGKDAGLIFIRDMVLGGENQELLDKVSLLFCPIFNVDGHENFGAINRINQNGPDELGTRYTAQLLNLNRDFMKADAPETRAWLKLFSSWLPELFIDVHVTDGADFQYVSTYDLDDFGTLMAPAINDWTANVYEKYLNEMMASDGFPLLPYFEYYNQDRPEDGISRVFFDPRYSESYGAMRNRPSLLIENHIYKPYRQRVECTIAYIRNSMKILAENTETLKDAVRKSDEYVASAEFRSKPYVLNFQITDEVKKDVVFLAWGRDTTISDLSGAMWVRHNYNKPINTPTFIKMGVKPTYTVMIPEYYILMPERGDIAEILDLHGVAMSRLDAPVEMEVETYRYTVGDFSRRQSEGRITVNARYTSQKEKLTAPAGSYVIDMNQPAAPAAVWALEPGAPGSLTYWGFFNSNVQASNEFWIRKAYLEEKGREMLAKDPSLKAEFEQKMKDKAFAANPDAILTFFYDIVKAQSEQNNDLHPAWRLMTRNR